MKKINSILVWQEEIFSKSNENDYELLGFLVRGRSMLVTKIGELWKVNYDWMVGSDTT